MGSEALKIDKERVVLGSINRPIFSSNAMAEINRESDNNFDIKFKPCHLNEGLSLKHHQPERNGIRPADESMQEQ